MRAILGLWNLLRNRRSDEVDPARLTGTLAVIAFAATTAVSLIVIGGLLAFQHRADTEPVGTTGDVPAMTYVVLAAIATLLLLIPLITLGAAAARLAMARRDARLAALRLAGATTGQVSLLTVLDAVGQAALGAVIGVLGYLALLPLVALLSFQGRRFELAELWVGAPTAFATGLTVVAVAAASAGISLRRVALTPLGVAARTRRPGLTPWRLASLALAFVAIVAVTRIVPVEGMVAIVIIAGLLAGGMATLNLIGPFLLGITGRVVAHRARTAATLLAGRRLADDPKAAWRSVGGVALASFIAGITSIIGMFDGVEASDADRIFIHDLMSGGLLTMVIAGLLAGVSTGVTQAARVIDQRSEHRSLILAGTDVAVLDAARLRETTIPLQVAMGSATVAMLALMTPVIGLTTFTAPAVIGIYLAGVTVTAGLVLGGAWSTRFVARRIHAPL